MSSEELPVAEFAFPGPLRDQLVAAILAGEKTTTRAEGYRSVAEWRAGHERFRHSADTRDAMDDPEFAVDNDTLVVAQAFRLAESERSRAARVVSGPGT